MRDDRRGQTAVIFIARRNDADPAGYDSAARAMDALAAAQPGYRGVDAVRDADGAGITVSYWADEDAALAWRRNPDHTEAREAGRGIWYDSYDLHVAAIGRSYNWDRR